MCSRIGWNFLGGRMLYFDVAMKYLKIDGADLAESTVRTYYWNLKKFSDFKPDLQVENISSDVVRLYKGNLISQGDCPATVAKALSVVRIFTNKMLADGLIRVNPFEKVKIGRVYTRRGFLTTQELKTLYLLYTDHRMLLTDAEQECVRVFLFSCFTGLRYSDLKTLDSNEIYDWKIRKQTQKTGEAVYIPIPLQARLLLPAQIAPGPIFHIVENCTFNRRLRKAVKKLGFGKYLHCHLARHTFATTCISLGISLPATSKLLGHRNLDTTLIYAKYVDTLLDEEMNKFNKLQ